MKKPTGKIFPKHQSWPKRKEKERSKEKEKKNYNISYK